MCPTDLQEFAQAVVSRARSQGFVVPRDIREELAQAGMPETQWKNVLALAEPQLSYRQGRYYFVSPVAARMHQAKRNQQAIQRAIRQLVRDYKPPGRQKDRRQHRRFVFLKPVTVFTADSRELHLLSSDISASGIRLIGTYNLQGQRIRILIPADGTDDHPSQWSFSVQILWAKEAGDNMFENGGIFVELIS